MTTGLRNLALTAHILCSVGWLGAVVAYLALVVTAIRSQDPQTLHAAWTAMEMIGWTVLVPLSLCSLLTGLIQSLATPWGVFRHFWILFKLGLTVLATTVLVLHMPTVSSLAGAAGETAMADLGGLRGELLHAGGGLLVLLVTTTLSVYKPRGMTPYGWRKLQERRPNSLP